MSVTGLPHLRFWIACALESGLGGNDDVLYRSVAYAKLFGYVSDGPAADISQEHYVLLTFGPEFSDGMRPRCGLDCFGIVHLLSIRGAFGYFFAVSESTK